MRWQLSPLDSFASELGARFAVRLEARHVVDLQRQVLAATVGVGPTRTSLAATYASAATANWQDEVRSIDRSLARSTAGASRLRGALRSAAW